MTMRKIKSLIRNAAGITLTETMIALFLTGLVSSAVFKVYIDQHKNWMIQEGITDMQQSARGAIDELTRYIRMAGYNLPPGFNAVEGLNTDPDTIMVSFCSDRGRAALAYDMATPSEALHCDGYDLSYFKEGQWLYIYSPDSGGGEFLQVSHIDSGAYVIDHAYTPLSQNYPHGSLILPIQSMKYYVDYSDSLHPNLMLQLLGQNPVVYAEGVDDIQFKYRMKNEMVLDVPVIPSNVREILITVATRSAEPDPDQPDPYRHRVFSSRVNLRNLDIRCNEGS
ncbi:hypothetical protein TRIP_C90193 [Candidatus Zixiibacteriota bacterium]|nr:hypothetical protein TRIP_C90193 [candidate division Zixibacteria bacterium]